MADTLVRLKADFHMHARGDPQGIQRHTPKELILKAERLGFSVLSITNKNIVTYSEELADFAKEHGILLIPGTETRVSGKEVLIINHQGAMPKTFEELRELRKKNSGVLTIAPHPYYYVDKCLKDNIYEHADLFDAIEYCHFYLPFINQANKRAMRATKILDKALVATSDAHQLPHFGQNCTWIQVPKNPTAEDVIEAIRTKKTEIQSRPIRFDRFVLRVLLILTVRWNSPIRRKIRDWDDRRKGREPL